MTNHDWEKLVDTSDEWVFSRTGIRERRIADDQTAASDLGAEAANRAMEDAGVKPEDIDLIIVATTTPDHVTFPSTAAILQETLGLTRAGAFDLSAACSGFVYGFSTAAQFISTGTYSKVLLVAVDLLSKHVDKTDRGTCVLFGDGAGAVVLEPVEEGSGLLSSDLGARGSGAEFLKVPAGGTRKPMTKEIAETTEQYIHMHGREVFKFAVNIMGESIKKALDKAGLTEKDIDYFVPHQANIRIIDSAMKKLELPPEKVHINVDKYGNTSSASIPIGLDEAYKEGKIKKGDVIAVCGFGAGLTWGSNIFRWAK